MIVMQNMHNLMKPISSEIKILYDAFLVKKAKVFMLVLDDMRLMYKIIRKLIPEVIFDRALIMKSQNG